jgi:hypothetical protein
MIFAKKYSHRRDTHMPQTATLEDIEAHRRKIEKDEITPDNLPPCPCCSVEPVFFKVHAFRERRFLIIVAMLIKKVFCSLVRFKCPGCGTTFTHYPDFAIPHKHYTRQTTNGFSAKYVNSDDMTYQRATMGDDGSPGYPESDATLAPSTIHRWVTTLSNCTETCRTALCLLLQQNTMSIICRDLARLTVPQKKYKTDRRKKQLIACRKLVIIGAFFHDTFGISIFTGLATRCGFG